MNGTDFLRLLKQPRLLYELPASELHQLAMRFPYSANLRLLLLLKSHLDGHPDEQAYLARCAAATFDRASVYDVLRELEALSSEEPEAEDEFLELRELDDLLLEDLSAAETEAISLAEQLPEPGAGLVTGWEAALDAESEYSGVDDTPVDVSLAGAVSEDHEEAPAIPGETPESPPPPITPPSPESPGETTGYGTLQERLARIRERQRTAGVDHKEDVNRIARRSLIAQEEVASETLAKLLIRQGQYQHAIKMYQRLILLYPEKKPTFAGLIKDLKEKL